MSSDATCQEARKKRVCQMRVSRTQLREVSAYLMRILGRSEVRVRAELAHRTLARGQASTGAQASLTSTRSTARTSFANNTFLSCSLPLCRVALDVDGTLRLSLAMRLDGFMQSTGSGPPPSKTRAELPSLSFPLTIPKGVRLPPTIFSNALLQLSLLTYLLSFPLSSDTKVRSARTTEQGAFPSSRVDSQFLNSLPTPFHRSTLELLRTRGPEPYLPLFPYGDGGLCVR